MESRQYKKGRPIIKNPPPASAYGPGPKQVPKPSWYPVEQTWRGYIPQGMTADKRTWPIKYVEDEAHTAGRARERRLTESERADRAKARKTAKKPSKTSRLLKGAGRVAKGVAKRVSGRSPVGMALQGMDTAAFRKAMAKKPKSTGPGPKRGGPSGSKPSTRSARFLRGGGKR